MTSRVPALLLALTTPVLLGAILPAPAQAATCSSAAGVSVIVNFGGSVQTGCAAGDPGSAWGALQAAGFSVEGTQRFPTTFICRINGYPGPKEDACVQTPPATAYWAFWTAPAGGSWAYSNTGAASYNPAPGSAVGFGFGAGRQPGLNPPAAPKPPPASTTRPSSTSTTRAPANSPGSTSSAPRAGSGTSTISRAGGRSATSTSTSSTKPTTGTDSNSASTTGTMESPSSSAPTAMASPPNSAPPAGGGSSNSALAFVGGAGGTALILAAAYGISRRRRNESS